MVGVLSDDADPMVTVMKLEKAPKESYADIGGLDQQIQEIKVVIMIVVVVVFFGGGGGRVPLPQEEPSIIIISKFLAQDNELQPRWLYISAHIWCVLEE